MDPSSNNYLSPHSPTNHYLSSQTNFGSSPSFAGRLGESHVVRDGYHISNNNFGSRLQTSNVNPNHNAISRVRSETSRLVSSQVKGEEVVKGESRVNYVPYERKVVEYENRSYV